VIWFLFISTNTPVRVGSESSLPAAMATWLIAVENKYSHPIYEKTLKKTRRFMAHDEKNDCIMGDIVLISETRPLSKNKRWEVKQILTKTKKYECFLKMKK
jgi:small subunit ribosomal protein S17